MCSHGIALHVHAACGVFQLQQQRSPYPTAVACAGGALSPPSKQRSSTAKRLMLLVLLDCTCPLLPPTPDIVFLCQLLHCKRAIWNLLLKHTGRGLWSPRITDFRTCSHLHRATQWCDIVPVDTFADLMVAKLRDGEDLCNHGQLR